ncbi:hypothetical protein Pflav_035730 [Phytohabitans flavus]|uniref:Uncharacterized protein n=1 Tax=Phytohabitans flavus TaxID=1076124 RepID=A0A6F8XTK4_9ACTN|nr:hypothetical protein [Phytohabitans flavus]BCB77163.1 hypothetical protein Pflav_035730 [Phytohabitans flavus]
MNGVDIQVFQHRVDVGVPALDAEVVGDPVQRLLGALAHRDELGVRVGLIDRDELGAKT